jgi:AraC-like DNA-binding protein
MEIVNTDISIEIKQSTVEEAAYCTCQHKHNVVTLNFMLNAKECLFDLGDNNYIITVTIAHQYFKKYEQQFTLSIISQAICCNTQAHLHAIIHNTFTGLQRQIFLESEILFLLHQLQKNTLVYQVNCDGCSLINKPIDTEKIYAAKAYILNNIAANITIPTLASKVGTNVCYLKKGFKEVYHQTIFEYIQEQRMGKAQAMLQQGKVQITDVALAVGYASLSSFSQAFKNYYGYSPAELVKANITDN